MVYDNKYNGPEFMQAHFYQIPEVLKVLLPEHNVHQGLQCTCGHQELRVFKRAGYPTIFARCEACDREFKVYENGDYPAGYITDDPTKSLDSIKCNYCGELIFQLAVGYEYSGDEIDSTDVSWFTLVGKCAKCGTTQEMFYDETA